MSPSDDEIYDEEEDEVPRNATTIEFENSDITNIEHPSIIKNVDNAIKSLGGVPNIDSVRLR